MPLSVFKIKLVQEISLQIALLLLVISLGFNIL